MSITVYILTTQGPVRIQRITEEQPGIQSVICLDGRAHALPISSRYDAFVRNPTGVIERATGHSAYRVDVDKIIDDGDSWQLAIYIAHMMEGLNEEKDIHIFATGEVDRDLNIRSVEYVREKLDRIKGALKELKNEGSHVHIFVPDEGHHEAEENSDLASVPVRHIYQVFDHLKLPHPQPSSTGTLAETGLPSHSPESRRLWFVGLPIALLMSWFLWAPLIWMGLAGDGKILELENAISENGPAFINQYQQDFYFFIQGVRQPDLTVPDLSGQVIMADTPEFCNATTRDEASWNDNIPASNTICEIVVRADSDGLGSVLVGRMGYWPNGLGVGGTPARTMRGSARANGYTWTLEFEDLPTENSVVRLVILKGLAAPVGAQPWYAPLLSEQTTSAAFIAAKARIERLGYHVFVRDWQRL